MLGYLSDKIPLRVVISLSCFGSALSCILLWGFATNAGVLVAFVVLFGLLGLSFSALWTKLITIIARESPIQTKSYGSSTKADSLGHRGIRKATIRRYHLYCSRSLRLLAGSAT
jgi:MFS family permease